MKIVEKNTTMAPHSNLREPAPIGATNVLRGYIHPADCLMAAI